MREFRLILRPVRSSAQANLVSGSRVCRYAQKWAKDPAQVGPHNVFCAAAQLHARSGRNAAYKHPARALLRADVTSAQARIGRTHDTRRGRICIRKLRVNLISGYSQSIRPLRSGDDAGLRPLCGKRQAASGGQEGSS